MTYFIPMRWSRRTVTAAAVVLLCSCGGGGGDHSMPAPTVTLEVSPTSVTAGETATLTWSSTNATACTASGAWAGPESISGNLEVSQDQPDTYTYTLDCSSSASNAVSRSAMLTVTPAPLSIITGALPNGVMGDAYDQTIQANGGVSPFAWTVSSGALPHNLSLKPSTTNVVNISGTPDTAAQAVTFTIQVTDSANHTATQPYTVSILQPGGSVILSSDNLDFGNVVVGNASSALTETLWNSSSSELLIASITTTGSNASEFTQTSTTCGTSLAAGASCSIRLTFTPGELGPRTAALTINDDSAGSPESISLNGVGMTAGSNATLSADSVPFGTQLVGTTSGARSVTLSNYGSTALNLGSILASTSFAETNTCGPSLVSGGTCTITVTFMPSASGDFAGTLSISDDATDSPQSVALSGTGSTSTPQLTGYCLVGCQARQALPSECPAGALSESPAAVRYTYCGLTRPFFVDRARYCHVGGSGNAGAGYCQTFAK
jgi:hypothetical protein